MTSDERYLVSVAGESVHLWETSTLRWVGTLRHHSQPIGCVAIAPRSRWIATASQDYQVKIWGYLPGGMARVRPKGFLGIRVQDDGGFVQIVEVIAGTAAAGAGLRVGDVVQKVAEQKVIRSSESIAAIGSFFEGDEVEFTILRDGAEMRVSVKLGKRPER